MSTENALTQFDISTQALLRLLCWFTGDPIPFCVLQSGRANLIYEANLRRLARAWGIASSERPALETVLSGLLNASLIHTAAGEDAFRIDRDVQIATRVTIELEQRTYWLRCGMALIQSSIPCDPRAAQSIPLMNKLEPHLEALVDAGERAKIYYPTTKLMSDLGMLRYDRGEFDRAESLFRRVVVLSEQRYGATYHLTAFRRVPVARALQAMGRHREAESHLRISIEALEKTVGPDSAWLCDPLDDLASVFYWSKQLDAAESTARRSLEIVEETCGADHWSVACSLDNLAFILHLTDPHQAALLVRRALDIDERIPDPPHAQLAAHIYDLALARMGPANSLIGIERLLHRAAEIFLEIFGPDHIAFATSLYWDSLLLAEKQEFDEAEAVVRKAMSIHDNPGGKNRWLYFRDLNQLALICTATKRYRDAEELFTRLRAEHKLRPGFASLSLACCLHNTAQLHWAMERNDTAEVLFCQSLDIYLQFGADTGRRHRQLPFSVRSYRRLLGEMKCSEDEIDARLRIRLEPFGISANNLTIPAASL